MSTWIGHLRIAENILAVVPNLDQTSFTFGNLSPDAGIPNADWTVFDPPKRVTHFLWSGNDEADIHDIDFYREYLAQPSQHDNCYFAFALGYFFHLLCDNLWAKRIWSTTKQSYAPQFSGRSTSEAVELVKTDWYGIDQRYVRDHPESIFWRVFLNAPNPPGIFLSSHLPR